MEEESRLERLRDRVAIGGAAFARRMRESFGQDVEGREQKRELRRRITAEEVRTAVERVCGARWEELAGRRDDGAKALFLWGVRKRCGLTLREAGEAAGGMKPTAVDMAVRRLENRAAEHRPLRAKQRKILRHLDDKSGKWNPEP